MLGNASRRSRAHVDVPLIALVFGMCIVGIYAVCVATYSIDSTATTLLGHILESSSTLKQCFFVLVVAPIVLVLILMCPYHLIRRATRTMYVGTTVLVLVVWVFNRASGVKAWLDVIWNMTIQPSEFLKLAMILMLAQRLSQSEHPMSTFREFMEIMLMVLIPCGIVMLSGETGSAIVVVFACACMMLFANVRWRLLITLTLVVVLLVLALYGFMVATGSDDYRLARIVAFLNPDLSPQDDAYQMRQSKMTIGAGGLTGIGTFVTGSMSQLNYVPADWTDFIYATIGEATGFIGCTTILVWYFIIILRMLYLARYTYDRQGMLIIIGVIGMMLFHVFENIGMTLGLLPITGIPLPFLSYGGSNMVTNIGGIALVLNVTKNRSLTQIDASRKFYSSYSKYITQ